MDATSPYVFYGLASQVTGKVFDWYLTPEDAERAHGEIENDDPDLASAIYITRVDFSEEMFRSGPSE